MSWRYMHADTGELFEELASGKYVSSASGVPLEILQEVHDGKLIPVASKGPVVLQMSEVVRLFLREHSGENITVTLEGH